jgi:uncharacterized protein YbaA (DUF1428 family)
MERYVDGFLIPVPKDNVSKYKEMAQKRVRSGKNMVP